jgi:hypothetical protein
MNKEPDKGDWQKILKYREGTTGKITEKMMNLIRVRCIFLFLYYLIPILIQFIILFLFFL